MGKCAIIHYDPAFSFFEEFLFIIGKLKKEKYIKEIDVEGKKFKIYNVPISKKHAKKGLIFSYIINIFLKKVKLHDIKYVMLSDSAEKIEYLKNKTSELFYFFNGKSVINKNFENILKKYIQKYKSNENKLIFFAEDFDLFYTLIKNIFKDYQIRTVVTDNTEIFKKFSENIYEEYGIFINIVSKEKYINRKSAVIINADSEKNFCYDIDLKHISLIFSKCNDLNFIYKYFKYIDETVLEYMIYSSFSSFDEKYIKRFLDDFKIRIVNFIKK